MTNFSHFMNDESGATAIEYGLIAAIIGVGIIAVLKNVRTQLAVHVQHREQRTQRRSK